MATSGIRDSLKQRGVRLTRQRQILLDLIDQSGQHLDAERLFELAREKDPKLNRVTVYRTLKLLKAGGLVDELDLMHHEGDQHYYETRLKQEHAHVICLRCGKIEEFFGDLLRRCGEQIESHLDSRSFWRARKWAAIAPTARCCARKNLPRSRLSEPSDDRTTSGAVCMTAPSEPPLRHQSATSAGGNQSFGKPHPRSCSNLFLS